MTANKTNVRFLAVIWGERYVNEFAAISLPSYLAPGNLPALAAESELEVLIMTSQESLPAFNRSPAFARLREICPVRFIMIDDLIADGVYGVTLTLAYARGIRSMGGAQTQTYFVFMNSDFVLADGSLRNLAELMQSGHPCIMAASLRGQAEAIVPELRKEVSEETGQLAMPPRDMVALTLANLHATVVAKTMNQSQLSCLTQNQLYWRIDDQTLLCRSYLIFMLAIRPEIPLGPVNSYCDYGFVPEMVPSGKIHVIGDSDDFFMLELQPAEQEEEYLTYGSIAPAELARQLSTWTTAEHRRFAQCDTIFHAGDLPPVLDDFRAQANATVGALAKRMRKPKNHADHVYWTNGLRWWWFRRRLREARSVSYSKALADAWRARALAPHTNAPLPRAFPEELLRRPARFQLLTLKSAYPWLLDILRARQGSFPYLSAWHPRWPDARLLISWIDEACRRGAKVRVVDLGDRSLIRALANNAGVESYSTANQNAPTEDTTSGGDILVRLPATRLRDHAELQHLDHLLEQVRPDGRFGMYLYHPGHFGFTDGVPAALATLLSRRILTHDIELMMIGGRMRGTLLGLEHWCRRRFLPSSPLAIPFTLIAACLWPAATLLISLGNRLWWSECRKRRTRRCGSIMLTFRRRRAGQLAPRSEDILTNG